MTPREAQEFIAKHHNLTTGAGTIPFAALTNAQYIEFWQHVNQAFNEWRHNEQIIKTNTSAPFPQEASIENTLKAAGIAIDKMKTSAIDEAKEIIYGDREQTYGKPAHNLRNIADYWMHYMNTKATVITKAGTAYLTPEDVCIMMILLKIARQSNSYKRDNIVDAIGYLGLIDRIAEGL